MTTPESFYVSQQRQVFFLLGALSGVCTGLAMHLSFWFFVGTVVFAVLAPIVDDKFQKKDGLK